TRRARSTSSGSSTTASTYASTAATAWRTATTSTTGARRTTTGRCGTSTRTRPRVHTGVDDHTSPRLQQRGAHAKHKESHTAPVAHRGGTRRRPTVRGRRDGRTGPRRFHLAHPRLVRRRRDVPGRGGRSG